MKITIIGWNAQAQMVKEEVSHWPDEMDSFIAIARASRKADVVLVEKVLVEMEEDNGK